MAIEIDSLSFCYPGAPAAALRDIHLKVAPGELVGLVGANRAGKTTLCYALAGIVPHYYRGRCSGSVRINGVDTRRQSIAQLAREVGLVMQHPTRQFSGMRFTVFEEAAFSLENLGVPRELIGSRVNDALSMVGLAQFAARSPFQLSGGQQQRLVIASAIAATTDIMVLDEPTTFLDPQGALHVFDILTRLRNSGKTVIVAEQNLEWLALHADRVVILRDGKIILDGPPADILSSNMFLESGLSWLRYTQAAERGFRHRLWPSTRPLPVTLDQAVDGFSGR